MKIVGCFCFILQISFFFVNWTCPILESKGMCAIFRKRVKNDKIFENWTKIYKIWTFWKRTGLHAIIACNMLLEKALLDMYIYFAIFLTSGNILWIHPPPNYKCIFNILMACAALIVSVWLNWMLIPVFVFVF